MVPGAQPRDVAQVAFTVDADTQLRRTAGLRAKVASAVLGILETALELRRLGSGNVQMTRPLVGSHAVMYSLDLEQGSATIWRAEPLQASAA
jgi:hypothetical protein